MIVNFEFLGIEPVENVITCMHFKMDKVVYFGYPEMIAEKKKATERFLKEYCGVEEVVFLSMPKEDLPGILKTMRQAIEYEKNQNSSMYFDVTGGEHLILVAFGMLAKEYDAPMHQFDVRGNRAVELEEGSARRITEDVPKQKVTFDLDKYIELRGGIVNYNLHKAVKGIRNQEFSEDVEKIWTVAKKNWESWNPFSGFLSRFLAENESLRVDISMKELQRAFSQSNSKIRKVSDLNRFVEEFARLGIVKNVKCTKDCYCFTFKNEMVKSCLMDPGTILELYTYQKERARSKDCRVGVHLDWDGVVQSWGMDVLNEIDVLCISGNVPTFISCKGGKMTAQTTLHALYELETVTRRFGGRYAKKVLVTARPIGRTYMERAEELGIEVRCEVE